MKLLTDLAAYVLSMQVEGVKTATQYVDDNLVLKITIIGDPKGDRSTKRKRIYTKLTVGYPNFAERKFIKACRKAGESLAVRKVQYKHFK